MATGTYDRERELTATITPAVESSAARRRGAGCRAALAEPVLRLRRPSRGGRSRALRAGDARCSRLPVRLDDRRLVARPRAPAASAASTSAVGRRSASKLETSRRRSAFAATVVAADDHAVPVAVGRDSSTFRSTQIVRGNLIDEDGEHEPGDHRGHPHDRAGEGHRDGHARLPRSRTRSSRRTRRRPAPPAMPRSILDDEGEFRVFAIEIPGDLEERLLEEAREARSTSSSASRRRPASASTR